MYTPRVGIAQYVELVLHSKTASVHGLHISAPAHRRCSRAHVYE